MASAPQFEAALREIIDAEREAAVQRLTGGLESYPTYREEVGFIRCLDSFGDWCAEVGKTLDER